MHALPTPALAAPDSSAVSMPPASNERSAYLEKLKVLVQRVADGDGDAFAELYASTVSVLFSFARKVLRNRSDAEEIICDVYVQAWQSAGQYHSYRGSVMTWLFMICRARSIDRYRQNRAKAAAKSDPAGTFGEPCSADAGPCDLLSVLQEGSAMHYAIEHLSPVRRRLLALAFFQDLSHREIALTTNLAEGTVKSHIRRSLALLREELRETE
jgi:RNA polymerase sigma-70 factor (ECF subfamily)